MEKLRGARNGLQGQFSPVDRRGTLLVRPATELRQRHLWSNRHRRHVDEMADGAARGREQFHPADLPGVFSHQLHQPLGTDPHRQNGFPAAAAGQHALHRLAAAGGLGRRSSTRVFGAVRDDLCRREAAFASGSAADSGLRRPVRGGHHDSLLADVHAGGGGFLDGARPGHRVGLLQSVQYRADAG